MPVKNKKLELLPPNIELETKNILKAVNKANMALAELKGYAETIPNKNLLINAINLNEAKDSSEIENIITTHDELYKAMATDKYYNPAVKEVINYRAAIWHGFELVKEKSLLTTNIIIEIQRLIEQNTAGIRKVPGTILINENTRETIYVPPSGEALIMEYMSNLEEYINNDNDNIDPLIKLAVIHYQFESIHPFYDGNGRTGRIMIVLYLVLQGLLDNPLLYLSRYIIRNKNQYYSLFQEVREDKNWEAWILYMLRGIEQTADETLITIKSINKLINEATDKIKKEIPKIYSKELVELIFSEVYTKINQIENGLNVNRKTATKYLKEVENTGILTSQKIGKEMIYINKKLYEFMKM